MDVIEFFSGIGGMRLALTDATKSVAEINLGAFKAIDTSELVNQVYRHNFNGEEPWKVNIETIKVNDLDGKSRIWTMSPPCQPFTTTKDSKQLQSLDPRLLVIIVHAVQQANTLSILSQKQGFCSHNELFGKDDGQA